MPSPKFGRTLLFGIIGVVGPLVVLEVVLRTTHLFGARLSWSRPDPVLAYRYTPHRSYWYQKENDHPVTGVINGFGWRDRERTLEKPAGTVRVAVLGDSAVDGFHVELDSTFVALTERQLGREGHDVEVLNFGRSSMTQTEQLIILETEVLRFSPDVVALFFMPANDIEDVRRQTTTNTLRAFFVPSESGELTLDTSFTSKRGFKVRSAVNPLKEYSALVSLLIERYNHLRLARRMEQRAQRTSASSVGGTLSLCTANPRPAFFESFELNKLLLARIAEVCRTAGVRFLLVCNDWAHTPGQIDRYRAIDPTFDPGVIEASLRAHADSLDIDFLGLQEVFRTTYELDGVFRHWDHWNYDGHRLVAENFCAKLESIFADAGGASAGAGFPAAR